VVHLHLGVISNNSFWDDYHKVTITDPIGATGKIYRISDTGNGRSLDKYNSRVQEILRCTYRYRAENGQIYSGYFYADTLKSGKTFIHHPYQVGSLVSVEYSCQHPSVSRVLQGTPDDSSSSDTVMPTHKWKKKDLGTIEANYIIYISLILLGCYFGVRERKKLQRLCVVDGKLIANDKRENKKFGTYYIGTFAFVDTQGISHTSTLRNEEREWTDADRVFVRFDEQTPENGHAFVPGTKLDYFTITEEKRIVIFPWVGTKGLLLQAIVVLMNIYCVFVVLKLLLQQ
jgi:hypothetical protein